MRAQTRAALERVLTAEMRAALEQWSAALGMPWTTVPGLVRAVQTYAYQVRYRQLRAAGRSEVQARTDAGWECGLKGDSAERALRRWKRRAGDETSA